MSSKAKNSVADKGAFFILKGLAFFLAVVPRYVALGAGSALGSILWIFLKVQRKRLQITKDNLKNLFPDATDQQLENMVRRVCRHFGRFHSESMRTPMLKRSEFEGRIKFEGLHHFASAYREGKGVILATAHFGHFELGSCALALMGYPTWSVIRTVDNPDIDRLLDDARASAGLGIIKKESASKEIIQHLRKGNVVTIHTDLHAAFNNMYIKFFGQWAATFTTPAIISLRTKAPILSMFCFRNDATDSYTVRFYPKVEIEPTGNISANVRQITTQITGILENVIREAPEQWFWLHRRWKNPPDAKELEAIKSQGAIIDSVTGKARSTAA